MKIRQTPIVGVWLLEAEAFQDDRGFFNRIFCRDELSAVRENLVIVQANHSKTLKKGVVRGMHYQRAPHAEMKIVRCVAGSIFDVAVDLRRGSPTFLHWYGATLSAENMRALVIPEGCAHGFQALEEDSETLYLSTSAYARHAEGAVKYDDPAVAIAWPLEPRGLSAKDDAVPWLDSDFSGLAV